MNNLALERVVPRLRSFFQYDATKASGDLAAGLTTAVMLVPQGMGYAMIAGLPPIYGLYASLLPLLVYAVFGSSRQLAVGPVAMVSLLVAAGVSKVAEPGTSGFVTYAIVLALGVGVLQFAMGVARLGFLVNFLSHPIISGFTSAAALIIAFSQLKHLLGIPIERSHHVHVIVANAWSSMEQTHLLTLAIATGAIAALLFLERLWPRFPRALAVVAAASVAAWALSLDQQGLKVVGDIPSGLPPLALPEAKLEVVWQLLPAALAISLVGFMESVAVAKRYARENNYEIDANRELVGLGLANAVGSLAGAFPVTGGFSRTAVNAQAGAATKVAGIVTALFVLLSLLFLTPLFYYQPVAVLAAIIVTAVVRLIDLGEVRHLWKVKRTDLALMVATFALTLLLGIEEGIAVGVGASLLVLVIKTTRPHFAVLGRLPGSDDYRNVHRHPEALTTPGVLALRLDAQLYFGNEGFLKKTLARLEKGASTPVRAVVLDASGTNQLDASGEAALRDLNHDYRARGVRFVFANLKGPVLDVLERSGLLAELGEDARFLNVHAAMQSVALDEKSRDSGVDSAETARQTEPSLARRSGISTPSGALGT